MSNICLVILIGIPGAGKSYFCKCIKDYLQIDKLKITNISYDECEQSNDSMKYRNFRNNVLANVNNILSIIVETGSTNNEIIIVDDNMYYQSMRHSYYKLARKFKIGFCQIFMNCDINLAIERNNLRTEGQISVDTIKNMFEKLEPPSKDNTWEKYFCEILSDSVCVKDDIGKVKNMIQEALNYPVECDQHITGIPSEPQSFIHEVDLILRNQVGLKIQDAVNAGESRQSIQLLSEELKYKKKIIIDGMKKCEMLLPEFKTKHELEHFLICFLNDGEIMEGDYSCINEDETEESLELESYKINHFNVIESVLRLLITRKIKDAILALDSQETVEILSQKLLLKKKNIMEAIRNSELIIPEHKERPELENMLSELFDNENVEPSVKRAKLSSD